MAGRAGRRPGCWTSRPAFRTTGRFATSPGPSTRDQPGGRRDPDPGIGLARRAWSSAPTSPAPSGAGTASTAFSTITWSAARCGIIPGLSSSASARLARSCWNTARPTRSRARTCSRRPGAWTPGRWAPTASSLADRSGTSDSWKQADELALFYPHPAQDQPGRPAARHNARADSVDPPQVLSPRPAGRGVSDALVAVARRAAVGCRPASARGAEAGRHPPGHRLRRRRGRRTDRLTAGFVRRTSGPCASRSARPSHRPTLPRKPSWSTSARPAATRIICRPDDWNCQRSKPMTLTNEPNYS